MSRAWWEALGDDPRLFVRALEIAEQGGATDAEYLWRLETVSVAPGGVRGIGDVHESASA